MRQRSALNAESQCTWTVVPIKGKEPMQIDPQMFLFPYSNGEKNMLKELVFRKWLMVVGWAQGLGSFLCPQLGWHSSLLPPFTERSSEALSSSHEPRDHSTSVAGRLCQQARDRNRHSTERARLQSLATQVFFFSIWKGVWGTLPSFHFYLGKLGSFCSKTWKEGISAHLWNTLALALGERHQSA